jgi:hypothetical protein
MGASGRGTGSFNWSVERRIRGKVEVADCWVWTGHRFKAGYGALRVGSRQLVAHRWVYEELVGPVPDGLELDHLCRNRACVNPDHLEPVSHLTNVRRGVAGKWIAARSHCPSGHEYSGENTYEAGGRRHCRECSRSRARGRRRELLSQLCKVENCHRKRRYASGHCEPHRTDFVRLLRPDLEF